MKKNDYLDSYSEIWQKPWPISKIELMKTFFKKPPKLLATCLFAAFWKLFDSQDSGGAKYFQIFISTICNYKTDHITS